MRLWVRMEDTPSVPLLIPNRNPGNAQLVGLHLSLTMGYMDIAPYFCVATETVAGMENASMDLHNNPQVHPLEAAVATSAENNTDTPEPQLDDQWGVSQTRKNPPQHPRSTSTWVDLFPLSRESLRRGNRCCGTFFTQLTGYSTQTQRRKPTGKTPFFERNWARGTTPGLFRKLFWGGTLTPSRS